MKGLLETTFLAGPLQNSDISFIMEEAGKAFLSHHEKRSLIPASNMKLIVSLAALLLNEDQELFPPLLSYSNGTIKNGILSGDLIIDSCGSLIFSARFPANNDFKAKNEVIKKQIADYVKQLKNVGINEISGNIYLSFDRWNAEPENKHYTAAVAFSYNENTVDTLVERGHLETIPQNPVVFNFAQNSEIDDQDKVENNLIRYNPNIDSRDYWRISKSSATDYALKMFKKELQAQGITIKEMKLEKASEKKLLFKTDSLYSISEFITPLNKHSDNFRAELLALLINRLSTSKASYEKLDASIKEILTENGLNLKSLKIDDGSGLSRKNRISAFDINQILKFIEKSKHFKVYLNSLALASKSGTLKNRFKGTPWEGTFYGKTGTLNGVSALSGYWIRKDKPVVTFSFIGNKAENKVFWEALEKFAASLRFMA